MVLLIILLLLFLSILVCIYDWRLRKIPNYICIIIFCISILVLILKEEFDGLIYLLLAIPFFLIVWKVGIWGAGDSKLLLSFFPMIESQYYVTTVVFICLIGFATGVMFLIFKKISKKNKFNTVPYGIPIALSCFITSIASL